MRLSLESWNRVGAVGGLVFSMIRRLRGLVFVTLSITLF